MKIFLILLFGVSSIYAVESQLLLNVQKTWNGTEIQKTSLKNPKITVQKLTLKKEEKLPVQKHQNIKENVVLLAVMVGNKDDKTIMKK